jgi:hypothetical protein
MLGITIYHIIKYAFFFDPMLVFPPLLCISHTAQIQLLNNNAT